MIKIEILQSSLFINNIDGALILSPENIFYLTGFKCDNGYLAITKNTAVFITDSRYIEAAKRTIWGIPVILQKDVTAQLAEFFGRSRKIAIETDKVTVKMLNNLSEKMPGFTFLTDDYFTNVVSIMRSVKATPEIECIKTAQAIAENAFEHILTFISPGVTEKQIALELDFYMLSHGAEALSFETIAVSGANSSLPHGVPSDKKIENGDFVTLDFGAVYGGYHSDMTRTVAVGFATDEMKEVYNTVLEAQETCLKMLKAGIPCKKADKAARDVIENAGFGDFFGHSTGHGVGIEIHESPNLSSKEDKWLEKGNVVTVEPGIYLPGKFGVRIEDMVVISEKGCENLTHAEKNMIIL